MRVTVKVTEEMGNPRLQDKGEAVQSSCMVAQALRELVKEEAWIAVHMMGVDLIIENRPGVRYTADDECFPEVQHCLLPENERRLIRAYDCGLCVPAHEFEMDVPAKYLREREGK